MTEDNWSFSDEFKKGMKFSTKRDLIYAVKMHHIMHHYNFCVVDSDTKKWAVCCSQRDEGCPWRLCACWKRNDGAFVITKVRGPHTCVNSILSQDHPQLDSALMARHFESYVRDTPDVKVSFLKTVISEMFGYEVTRRRVWDGKIRAIQSVYGDWDNSYSMLPHLLNAIEVQNPGTKVVWNTMPSNIEGQVIFGRVFWAFAPCINAWKHCRPIVSIDGTFLYGKYKHKLLIACSMDGANHIVPLAFALVDEESYSTWAWFLRCLRDHVVEEREVPICLISDRHRGIHAAVNNPNVGWTHPFAVWRFCVRHIASNFNAQHKNMACKRVIIRAALQAQPRKWEAYMVQLTKLKADARHYFEDIPREQWTKAFDGGYRYGYMTTNLSESYNAVLKDARKLPVAALVEKTFYNCARYFVTRLAEAEQRMTNGENLTRYAHDMHQKWRAVANRHKVTMFNRRDQLFEVITGPRPTTYGVKGGTKHIVKLLERTCTCGKWQIYKIPCSHACAALSTQRMDSMAYVEDWYTMAIQVQCYQYGFFPYGDQSTWPPLDTHVVLPDTSRVRGKGRPRSTRIHNEMDIREPSRKTNCGFCKKEGHNKRSCPDRHKGQSSSNGRYFHIYFI